MNNRISILAIVILGFAARIFVAGRAPILLDESYYSYQGYLLLKGQIPFVNFYSYPPVPLLGIALSTLLFGHSVLAMRLPSVVFDTLTIYIVYLIAKDFFDARVGIISGLFYSLSPMIIWYGTVARELPMALTFTMLTFLLFERSIGGSKKYLLLSGIVIGVGWFTSRAIAFLGIVFLIYYMAMLFRRQTSLPSFLKEYGLIALGSILVLIPSYLYLLTRLSLSQINLLYGLAQSFLFPPIAPMTLGINLKVISQTLVQGLGLFIPAAICLIMMIASAFTGSRTSRILVILLSSSFLVYLVVVPQYFAPFLNYGVVPLYSRLTYLVDVLAVGLTALALINVLPGSSNLHLTPARKNPYLLALLPLGILGFYEYFGWSTGAFEVDYLWETIAACSIFAGVWGVFLIDRFQEERSSARGTKAPHSNRLLAISCLAIVLVAGYVNYYSYSNSYTGERPYPVSLDNGVAQYVASHTGNNSTILAEPIFAYLSDRSDILNFFTLALEGTNGSEPSGISSNLIPTDNGIVQMMQNRNVDYVVLDERLYGVITGYLPVTAQYINAFYSPVKTFYTNYSQYSLAGIGQPFPIVIMNHTTSFWNTGSYPGLTPYVQGGSVSQPNGNPIFNYTYSASRQAFLLDSQPIISESNSVMEFAPAQNASHLSYLQFELPSSSPFSYLDVSYSTATPSNCSSVSDYLVLVGSQGNWQEVYSGPVSCDSWTSASIDLSRFKGNAVSVRIVPYSNSSSPIPAINTTVVFQDSETSLLSYPGLAALLSVYSSRLDLRSAFVGIGSENLASLMELVNWASGVVNHKFVDSDYSNLSQYAWFYTLLSVYNSQPDLQNSYPNVYGNQTSLNGLFCWANDVVSHVIPDSSYSTLSQYAPSYENLKGACS